ncbi:MAG: SdiA-regulated domain-containing protein [Sulfurimonas sp.]|jgi:uncharacterized protein YjiK|nr:SdiA-regulated domain-containing protein [Sulfurimonadaceae bacterium]
MKNKIFYLLFFISTATFITHYLDIDDKALFYLSHDEKNNIIDKNSYIYKTKTIDSIKKNLSGVTYNENSDTLFVITNSPKMVYELDKNGDLLRTIKLDGFSDTEDLTHIKDELFAIVDERLSSIVVVLVPQEATTIYKNEHIKKFKLDVKIFENFGLEGISYDKDKDKFYVVNERSPKKILTIQGLLSGSDIKVKHHDELLDQNSFLSDLSAIHFDEQSKNIYLLSEESSLLARVDDGKNFNKYLSIPLEYPEGITKDLDGNFYIVSEPNIFLSITHE